MRPRHLPLAPLLALLCAACGASTTTGTPGHDAANHPTSGRGGTSAKAPATLKSAGAPNATPSVGARSATAMPADAAVGLAAEDFARGYAAYLTATATAAEVPDAGAQVRSELGPMIPRADRYGRLHASASPQPGSAGTYLITLADRAHKFLCSATITLRHGHAIVVALVPPDLDTVLSPTPTPAPAPGRSAVARAAARAFLTGYLPLLYGHGTLQQVKHMTGEMRRHLNTQPALPTPAMQKLHPRVVTLALIRQRVAWGAKALIADGSNTYELLLTLANHHGRWLVASAQYPQ